MDQKVVTREELLAWADNSVAFYGIDPSRISSIFLAQAYSLELGRIFDASDLTHPIKVLEGLASTDSTGPEERFRHPPLAGLYKKHFMSPRFIANNLGNFLKSKYGGAHFDRLWDEGAKFNPDGVITEEFIKYLSIGIARDPYEIRSRMQRLTGEWVVFHKHEGVNYYLTIGFHQEPPENIFQRAVLACEVDGFPFLVGEG